jgi:hypothetical protein
MGSSRHQNSTGTLVPAHSGQSQNGARRGFALPLSRRVRDPVVLIEPHLAHHPASILVIDLELECGLELTWVEDRS